MGNRSGKRFHDQHKRMLARIDGNYCLICKGEGLTRAPPDYELEIDHARTDLNPNADGYWEYDVTCLACKSCNLALRYKTVAEHTFIIRDYRARNERERERERESGRAGTPLIKESIMDRIDFTQGSTESNLKSYYEPLFERFVLDKMIEHGNYGIEDLLDEFFNWTKCSQTTSRRYLKGYSCNNGIYLRKKVKGVWMLTFRFALPRLPGLKKANRPVKEKEKKNGKAKI